MDFFKKQATSFLSSQDEPSSKKEEAKKPESGKADENPSYSELMGSANVLLDAARSQFGGNTGTKAPLDKAKLADAAEDVLQAASHYGKFEGTQYEGYVKKAEDYLQSYQTRDGADTDAPAEELKKSAEQVKKSAEEVEGSAPKPVETESEAPKAEAPAPPKARAEVPPPKSTGGDEEP